MTILSQPPYSPDLAPADFFIPHAQVSSQRTYNYGNKTKIAGETTEDFGRNVFFMLLTVEAP